MKTNRIFTVILLSAVLFSDTAFASSGPSYWEQLRQRAGSTLGWLGSKAGELYSGIPSVPTISDTLTSWYNSLSASMQQKLFYLGALAATGSAVYAAKVVRDAYNVRQIKQQSDRLVANIEAFMRATDIFRKMNLRNTIHRDLGPIAKLLGTNKNSSDFYKQLAPMVVGESKGDQKKFFDKLKIIFVEYTGVMPYLNEASPEVGPGLEKEITEELLEEVEEQHTKEQYVKQLGLQEKDSIQNLQIILKSFLVEESSDTKEILKKLFEDNYAKFKVALNIREGAEDTIDFWMNLANELVSKGILSGNLKEQGSKALYLDIIKNNIDRFKDNTSLDDAIIEIWS